MTPNCYIATTGSNAQEAQAVVESKVNTAAVLVHTEVAEDAEEQTTYVFAIEADVFNEDGDMDTLHQHFDLPSLANLPIEFV